MPSPDAYISAPSFAFNCRAKSPESFDQFIEQYSTQKAFSLERTRLPLPWIRWVYGDEKPTKVHGSTKLSDIAKEPTLAEYMQTNGLRTEVQRSNGNVVNYKIFKADTDWLMIYRFQLHGHCWRLEQFENQSL